jgi:flavin-dependent thymidylate synthase
MPSVTLIDYTGAGYEDPYHAADLLIFAKNTRVKMGPTGLDNIRTWPQTKKDEELDYIANTIPASWEFVSYTFLLEEVTRSFTHQLVRTRTASYAQQTMQILDMSGFSYHEGPSILNHEDHEVRGVYRGAMACINEWYKDLLESGVKTEDARELLPNGIHTNILAKANLRTFVDMFHTRISPRNLGMYRDVCLAMREQILDVHPWAKFFLARTVDKAMEELDEMIKALPLDDDVAGTKFKMLKLVDQIRRRS